jgi:hypothetical protein
MNYRDLGKTGLKISEVGFGCGNIGGLMVRGTFEEQVAAVTRAVELGINYFDTAPDYGGGMSEANLGKVLTHLKPDVRVGTKVRVSPEDLPGLDRFVTASVETSLTRLGREHVDLLQLHTPIMAAGQGLTPEDILGTGGVADVFEELRARGLARFLGITGLGDTTALNPSVLPAGSAWASSSSGSWPGAPSVGHRPGTATRRRPSAVPWRAVRSTRRTNAAPARCARWPVMKSPYLRLPSASPSWRRTFPRCSSAIRISPRLRQRSAPPRKDLFPQISWSAWRRPGPGMSGSQ